MSRLAPLTRYLEGSGRSHLRLSFTQIERIIGGRLPESARRHPAFWSNSDQNAYSKVWRAAGFVASRAGVGPEEVVFTRGASSSRDSTPVSRPTVAWSRSAADAILVGCVATKGNQPAPAKDFYTSDLFRRRRAYAEASGKPWFIVSAFYGLVEPDEVLAPYERSISDLAVPERAAWATRVAVAMLDQQPGLAGKAVELHAGEEYVAALRRPLQTYGVQLLTPLRGLRIGEQLQWYDRRRSSITATVPPASPARVAGQISSGREDLAPERVGRLVTEITSAFSREELDLVERAGAPSGGWSAMPEIAVVERLRAEGMRAAGVRLFLTFVAAMDRARDADRLWFVCR